MDSVSRTMYKEQFQGLIIFLRRSPYAEAREISLEALVKHGPAHDDWGMLVHEEGLRALLQNILESEDDTPKAKTLALQLMGM